MPDYRRFWVKGGTYFFTVNLLERRLDTLVRHIDDLREAVAVTRRERPFHIDAWVVLPDHMHSVWTLPPGDDDFSNRWKAIKIRFVQALPRTERRSNVRKTRGERGVWQRRYWEHLIRDDRDYERHVDYVHYNPVKHGYVTRVADWPGDIRGQTTNMKAHPKRSCEKAMLYMALELSKCRVHSMHHLTDESTLNG